MILRIKEFAVIEDGSPDTVVKLIPVTEGPEGAAVFGVSNEHNTDFKIGAGQTYLDRANPSFNIAVLRPDSSDVMQLETWASNQTDVYISAITLDGGFLFGDKLSSDGTVKIRTNQTLSDNDVYAFEVTRETTPGFDPSTGLHQSGFWAGSNIMGFYEWGDNDGDNYANGWDEDGDLVTASFSSGQQTLEADTTRGEFKNGGIYFPFEGEQITLSIDVDSAIGSYNYHTLALDFFDTSGSFISNINTNISGTGRVSTTGTTPTGSNLSYLRPRVRLEASSGTVTTIVSDPALKLGTDSTYTTF